MDMDFAVDCPLVRPRLPRYPVAVRRVASSLRTSFRRFLAVPPLRFTRASPPSGCTGDFHPQAAGHAQHTALRLRRTAARLRDVDGDATVERLALVPMKSQSVSHEAWSCGGCDLLGCGFIGWRDELSHRLDLHVAVLQLPLIILFQEHRTDQPDD